MVNFLLAVVTYTCCKVLNNWSIEKSSRIFGLKYIKCGVITISEESEQVVAGLPLMECLLSKQKCNKLFNWTLLLYKETIILSI